MMKMITLTILIVLISQSVFAPAENYLYLEQGHTINPYLPIIKAVTAVESANGKYLLNEKENAVGWFGIRPVRLDDYNWRTGNNITHEQCYEYEVGKMIFLYYASQIDYRDIESICISWNGVSEKNLYYKKILKAL